MRTYNVFFEAFGRKMQMKVEAANKFEAEEAIKDKITFHKIDNVSPLEKSDEDEIYDTHKEILNTLLGKSTR